MIRSQMVNYEHQTEQCLLLSTATKLDSRPGIVATLQTNPRSTALDSLFITRHFVTT